MDQQFDFRALLVKLQDCLSDNDRRRLHFIVGDNIPRQLRDNPTLGGTLSLLESLFDRAKISEQDFDYLIQAFREIHCWQGVKRLEEYQRQKQVSDRRVMIVSDIIEDNEDDRIQRISNITIEDSPEIKHDQIEISKEIRSSEDSSVPVKPVKKIVNINFTFIKQTLRSRLTTCQLILLILNILAILTVVLVTALMRKQTCPPKRDIDNVLILREGNTFGVLGGDVFDDALTYSLTLSDQMVGVSGAWAYDTLASLKFIYSNGATASHGVGDANRPVTNSSTFNLLSKESINGVTLYQGMRDIINPYQPNGTMLVVGIQFFTNRGRQSDLFGSSNGTAVYKEFFPDYQLTYARGRSYAFIDLLQFVWSKPRPQGMASMIGNI